jgi:hypothetical protein
MDDINFEGDITMVERFRALVLQLAACYSSNKEHVGDEPTLTVDDASVQRHRRA